MLRNRKTGIRLILFILAAGLAIGSITYGVKQIGEKQPGWQTIEVDLRKGHVTYTGGITLQYWAEGSSAEIRAMTESVKQVYSDSLYRAVEWLDARNTYEDSVNLASLNEAEGQVVSVSGRLAKVLADALKRTEAHEGFSVFAGALWNEWQTLLYLDEPLDYDPLYNPEQADRLNRLTKLVNDPENFSLEIIEKGETADVCLRVSPTYRQALEEMEINAPVLDLGIMREAYLLDLVAEDLQAAGLTDGVLYGKNGMSVLIGAGRTLTVSMEEETPASSFTVSGPAVTARFSASGTNSDGYGAYTAGGLKRHFWFDVRTGGFRNRVGEAILAGSEVSAAEIAWQLMRLNCAENPESLQWPDPIRVLWRPQEEGTNSSSSAY